MSRLKVLALLAVASVLPLSSTNLQAQAANQFTSGTSTLVLNGEFISAITADGVTPTPAYPGTLSGTTATFPIVTGGIDLDTAAAAIYHSGGLTFTSTSAGKTVTISQFAVTTEGSAGTFVLGLITVNNGLTGLFPMFNVTGKVPVPISGPAVNIPKLTLTVTGQLAGLLNQAFGVTGFSEGDVVGVLDVQGTVANFGTTGNVAPVTPVVR